MSPFQRIQAIECILQSTAELDSRSDLCGIVDLLMEILSDSAESVVERQEAALLLGRMGTVASPAVPLLISSLENPDLRECAIYALGQMGPTARTALPHLRPYLNVDLTARTWLESSCFLATLRALRSMNDAAAEAMTELMRVVQLQGHETFDQIASLAIEVLENIGPKAVPFLVQAILSRSPRWEALRECLRNGDRRNISILITLLDSPNAYVRQLAADALRCHCGEVMMPILFRALQDRSQYWADRLQGSDSGNGATQAFKEALQNEDTYVRGVAVLYLNYDILDPYDSLDFIDHLDPEAWTNEAPQAILKKLAERDEEGQ